MNTAEKSSWRGSAWDWPSLRPQTGQGGAGVGGDEGLGPPQGLGGGPPRQLTRPHRKCCVAKM